MAVEMAALKAFLSVEMMAESRVLRMVVYLVE